MDIKEHILWFRAIIEYGLRQPFYKSNLVWSKNSDIIVKIFVCLFLSTLHEQPHKCQIVHFYFEGKITFTTSIILTRRKPHTCFPASLPMDDAWGNTATYWSRGRFICAILMKQK